MAETSEIEQLANVFDRATGRFAEEAARKAELARAMGDQETLVKQQIKMEVLKSVREIFQVNYRQITGGDAWT